MTYETILSCPNCGKDFPLVAESVVAERDSLREALAAAQRDAELALAGIPDPVHPLFPPHWSDRLAASQVLLMEMAGHDDPGNVEMARAALASLSNSRDIPREAAAFSTVLTDDSENEPPDVQVPGDDFGS